MVGVVGRGLDKAPDEVELVHVRLARPQRLALHQLHEDAAWAEAPATGSGIPSTLRSTG
jgi:hypothetical protein